MTFFLSLMIRLINHKTMKNSPHSISHDCFPCVVTNTMKHLSDSCLCAHFSHCCGVFLGDFFFSLTSSAAMVRQGQCFLVSLILTALALWTVFRALDRFSGVTSKQISLASEDTPSIWYSSKKLACNEISKKILID